MKKSFKLGVVAALLVVAGVIAFAFDQPKPQPTEKTKVVADVVYRFTGAAVCFPIAPEDRESAAQRIENTNNWAVFTGNLGLLCPGGICVCAIVVPEGTTLAEALAILAAKIRAGDSFSHGATYTNPSATKSVTVYLKAAA